EDMPRRVVEFRKAWLRGEIDTSKLFSYVEKVSAFESGKLPPIWQQPRNPAWCAVRAALGVYGFRRYSDGPTCDVELNGGIGHIVAGFAQWARAEKSWTEQSRKQELAWQLEQIMELLFA